VVIGRGAPAEICNIQIIRNIDTRFYCARCMLAVVHMCSTKE
jgi:hypothetical protein